MPRLPERLLCALPALEPAATNPSARLPPGNSHVSTSCHSLESALPLLDKYKIPLGLENHKDWTADELLAIVQKYSSEYFGVCLDFGNNIALLETPMETIGKLAPYTVTTHVKDVAVDSHPQGILLSEVILGKGIVDLPRALQLIRQARPGTRMNLEMITRAPLQLPMLTDDYWPTLPGKNRLRPGSPPALRQRTQNAY